jgi:hypothetical protein
MLLKTQKGDSKLATMFMKIRKITEGGKAGGKLLLGSCRKYTG